MPGRTSPLTRVRVMPAKDPDRGSRLGVVVVVVVGVVVVATGLVGWLLARDGVVLHLIGGVLIRGPFDPQLRWSIILPVVVAGLVVWRGGGVSRRLSWPLLLAASSAGSLAWSVTLALSRTNSAGLNGVTGPLESRYEYLYDVPRVDGLGPLLREYVASILSSSPDPWTTHVAGHPPGPLAFFAGLQAIGLGGSGWAATACVLVGSSAVAAVLVAVRALHSEDAARSIAPYFVLAPFSLWIATSADTLWTATSAWGIALLCLAVSRPSGRVARFLGAGLLLGLSLFGSYGVAVLAIVVLAVLWAGRVRLELAWVALGAVAPMLTAGLAGFWWWEGLATTSRRVLAGPGSMDRPFAYFVVANLAVAALALGPAVVAALADRRVWLLPLAWSALAAIVVADLTGLSKGEVERIWLPFYPWVTVAVLLLPRTRDRRWLAAQAILTLLLTVLIRTEW